MAYNLIVIGVAIKACEFIWRVVRIANGEPFWSAIRGTSRIEFIIWFFYFAIALGCAAYAVDSLLLKIVFGLLGAGSAMISVLEIIYGEPEPPVKPPAPTPDTSSESN